MASVAVLEALCEPTQDRECWACEGQRTTSAGDALCLLCDGEGALPSNPLDRRRSDTRSVYGGLERRSQAPPSTGLAAPWWRARSPTRRGVEPTLTAAVWNALGLLIPRASDSSRWPASVRGLFQD